MGAGPRARTWCSHSPLFVIAVNTNGLLGSWNLAGGSLYRERSVMIWEWRVGGDGKSLGRITMSTNSSFSVLWPL